MVIFGLSRGLWAPFRGAAFVARHALWGYLVGPVLANTGLAIGATWGAVWLLRTQVAPAFFLAWPVLGTLLLALLGVVLGVLLFILGQPVVSAPFIDLLSERVEEIVTGRPAPSIGLVRSTWLAVLHGVLKLCLYAVALGVTLALGAVTGVGGALGLALYAVFLAYDGFDYPLARRDAGFREKWRYLVLHPAQTLGYCCGASLLYLVPLAALVAPAFAAVGATLAYLDAAAPSTIPGADKTRGESAT